MFIGVCDCLLFFTLITYWVGGGGTKEARVGRVGWAPWLIDSATPLLDWAAWLETVRPRTLPRNTLALERAINFNFN
jgi:hypothetical protein